MKVLSLQKKEEFERDYWKAYDSKKFKLGMTAITTTNVIIFLLGILSASLLGGMLSDKEVTWAGEKMIREVYSRNNSPKIKDGAFVINLELIG